MGLLDGLLGGAVGAEMVTVVNSLIEKHGGVQGLMKQFQEHGFGETMKSWVGPGENKPISPAEVKQAVGPDTLKDLAAKAGMTEEQLSAKLSEILPTAIDKVTPHGTVV